MKRQEADGLTVNASGMVVITNDQYREYKELQAKRDRSLISLQTQMRLKESEWSKDALRLARAVTSGLIGDTPLGVAIVNNPAAAQAVELANELLATE